MKKLSLLILLMITATLASGQKSIDDLFDRYAGKDGFTTVTVNRGLLKLARLLGDKDDENDFSHFINNHVLRNFCVFFIIHFD